MTDRELAPNRAKPCPFCGHVIDTTDPDFCYPTTRPDELGNQDWCAQCPEVQGGCGAEVISITEQDAIANWNRREPAPNTNGQVYGIIDPDYGRVYTIIRKLAWDEGYAVGLHGSFTRDLDLMAVPWTEHACEPQHLINRIVDATDLRSLSSNPGTKPHGRLAWTFVFKTFADPRFVDLSILPRQPKVETTAEGHEPKHRCSECGKTSTQDTMYALYCTDCIKTKIGPALVEPDLEMTKLVEDMAKLHERSVEELVTSTNLGKAVPRADEHISVDSSLHDEEAWNSEALEHVKSLHCRTWRVIRVYYSLRIITIHSRPVATMVMLREVQT